MQIKKYQGLFVGGISLSTETVKSIISQGQYGCYFEPLGSWVDLEWLENNGYEDIAARIIELIDTSNCKLRFFVRFKKNTGLCFSENDKDNLILSYATVKNLKKIWNSMA